ncbi:unnamed protein product [Mytilus coruscus]|uniref:Uncharacterized protein n=1 Tax=Mytilus coruscus TaxID=42192 RepID=A0A6J8AQN8_MYTCO|nr:unnamed protein product [Mytilus coruscus]
MNMTGKKGTEPTKSSGRTNFPGSNSMRARCIAQFAENILKWQVEWPIVSSQVYNCTSIEHQLEIQCDLKDSIIMDRSVTLISSSDRATIGVSFTFTCATNARAITFQNDGLAECTITGGDGNGTCSYAGECNTDYKYYCNNITDTYKLTIPSSYDIYTLHGSNWKCSLPQESGRESKSIQLYVNQSVQQLSCTDLVLGVWNYHLFSHFLSIEVTLTSSSDKATVGLVFTLTCGTNARAITFQRDGLSECTIIGGDGNGTCTFSGDYNKNYKYECFTSPGVYKLTIPSSFDIDILHGSNWTCNLPLESSKQSEIIQLYINGKSNITVVICQSINSLINNAYVSSRKR